jgi:hypothetical protein
VNEYVLGIIDDTTELDQVYNSSHLYHSDEFETLLERSESELVDLSDLEFALDFISIQCGDWFSRWSCSPADEPDIDAQAEFDNWEMIWRAFTQSHFKRLPDELDEATRRHGKQRDKRLLKYVSHLNQSKPLSRLFRSLCYHISAFLDFIGLYRFANLIYSRTVFPKHSVGRQ